MQVKLVMRSLNIEPDGKSQQFQMGDGQLHDVYMPVAQYIINCQKETGRRIVFGIVGPPGSGKTHFASVLCQLINEMLGRDIAIVIGMDGWHFANQLLEEKILVRKGQAIPLKAYKGAPESFDGESFTAFVSNVKMRDNLHFPRYDRNLHEPVSDHGEVTAEHKTILLEGNYLLLNESPWRSVKPKLDGTCFIWSGERLRWHTLMKRHMLGKKTAIQAVHHIFNVDMQNTYRIGKPAVDILLERINTNDLQIIDGL
ncbi:MAG: hypothetical protein JEZ00_10725 [Anaerolineaceae bacterium]|nr:hypothetical protein [Anaerolineaceae bacterium]